MLQLFFIVFLLFTQTVFAAGSDILFTNVNIFDGKNEKLALEQDVLIEGNLVSKIDKDLEAGKDTTVIDGTGKTLMPGLIDMHTHLMFRYGIAVMRSEFDAQAAGATGQATIFTEAFGSSHVFRKIMLRMDTWLNFLKP